MSKHTPGRWLQWADTNIVICLHSGKYRVESLRICEVATNTRNDEGAHNLRLIAAAPDLLEALQEMQKQLRRTSASLWTNEQAEADLMACAAIAKATGEQE